MYVCSQIPLKGDREEYITQGYDGKKIFKNIKSPYISI